MSLINVAHVWIVNFEGKSADVVLGFDTVEPYLVNFSTFSQGVLFVYGLDVRFVGNGIDPNAFVCVIIRKGLLLILAALWAGSLIESKMESLHSTGLSTLCLSTGLQTVSMVWIILLFLIL